MILACDDSNRSCVRISQADILFYAFRGGECLGDSLSATSIIQKGDNSTLSIPMGQYCGVAYPGPIVSEWLSKLVVTFKSDANTAKRGFQAKYEFLTSTERFRKYKIRVILLYFPIPTG